MSAEKASTAAGAARAGAAPGGDQDSVRRAARRLRGACALAIFASLGGPAAPAPAQGPGGPGTGPPPAAPAQPSAQLTDAVARALQEAQRRFEKSVDLWRDHSTWDSPWVARTGHFEVRTTVSHALAAELARSLHAEMLPIFHRELGIDAVPPAPVRVQVYGTIDEYNAFCDANGGAEHGSFLGSHNATALPHQPVAVAWSENPVLLKMQVTHGVAHQYLAAVFPQRELPTWVDEGLAAYFASFWAWQWTLEEFEKLKARNGIPRLRQLLRDGIDAYGLDTHARMIGLGMLFHYLLTFREDTRTAVGDDGSVRAPFRDWLRALLEGRDAGGHPCQDLFDDADRLEELERQFLRCSWTLPADASK